MSSFKAAGGLVPAPGMTPSNEKLASLSVMNPRYRRWSAKRVEGEGLQELRGAHDPTNLRSIWRVRRTLRLQLPTPEPHLRRDGQVPEMAKRGRRNVETGPVRNGVGQIRSLWKAVELCQVRPGPIFKSVMV